MKNRRSAVVVAIAAGFVIPQAAHATLPSTGQAVPGLVSVDNLLQNFMQSNAIPGATVAITHGGSTIYERGFGYSDTAGVTPMQENALMRLASVSKPITASAVNTLIKSNQLSLSSKVFNLSGNGGILNIAPYNGVPGDARLSDITVGQLLQHQGGWNRDTAGDLAFADVQMSQAMGLSTPPGKLNSARYILSQPLQFTPGSTSNYSNIGYQFLGMVVEQVAGQPYEQFVDSRVLAPTGIPFRDVTTGKTLEADKNAREPHYFSPYTYTNIYNPSGPQVPEPYGTFDMEKSQAFGGLIASSHAIAQLATKYIAAGPEIGKLRSDYTTYPSYWWYHTGSLPGTDTLMLQASWKDWTYSINFNQRPNSGSSYTDALVNSMQSILEGVTTWPAALKYGGDLSSDQWLTDGDISLFNSAWSLGSAAFTSANPAGRYLAGDFDANGIVNGLDIPGFRLALMHAGMSVASTAAVGVAGDYNFDGVVDAADYTVWADHFGIAGSFIAGDGNADGVIDAADYTVWADHFGARIAPAGIIAVPEPSTALLLAAIPFATVRRRR